MTEVKTMCEDDIDRRLIDYWLSAIEEQGISDGIVISSEMFIPKEDGQNVE